MADIVKIQVITTENTPYGEYRDAIYYSNMGEYDTAKADGTHDAEKAKRVANYVNMIQNPEPVKELSKEELMAIKSEILAQAEAQINELDVKIADAKFAKDIVMDGIEEIVK